MPGLEYLSEARGRTSLASYLGLEGTTNIQVKLRIALSFHRLKSIVEKGRAHKKA